MIFSYPAGLWLSKQNPTNADLRRVWRAQEIATRALELSFRNKVFQVLNRYAGKAARDAANIGRNINVDISLEGLTADLLPLFETQYRRVMRELGEDFFDGLEKALPDGYQTKDQAGIFQGFIDRYVDRRGALQVQHVTDSTKKVIRGAIQQAIANNMGPEDMAKLIRLKAGGIASKNRATVIARTETHSAAQYGQQAASESTGLQFRKFWLASDDERVRQDHTDAETYSRNTIIKNSEPFLVGGESLLFPGDPTGSPEQIINCRCGVARRPIIIEDDDEEPDEIAVEVVPEVTPEPLPVVTEPETIKEAEKLFKEKTGIPANYEGIQVETANRVNKHFFKLIEDYEHTLKGVSTQTIKGATLAQDRSLVGANAHVIELSKTKFANPRRMESNLRRSIERENYFHPIGCDKMESVITHEFGHTLTGFDIDQKKSDFYKELKKIKTRNSRALTKLYKAHFREGMDLEEFKIKKRELVISEYGKKNMDEFAAECFASYIHNPNPPSIAREVGELIDKFFKKKRD